MFLSSKNINYKLNFTSNRKTLSACYLEKESPLNAYGFLNCKFEKIKKCNNKIVFLLILSYSSRGCEYIFVNIYAQLN